MTSTAAAPTAEAPLPVDGEGRPVNRAFRRAAWKLAVFVVVAIFITSSVIATLLDQTTTPTVMYHAIVSDATGLQPGDTVRIAGVPVGQVASVVLRGDRADVTFTVDRSDPLPRSVNADIRFADLLGQRYLDLVPGGGSTDPGPGDRLAAGATIPVTRTAPSLDLTTVFSGFQPLFSALQPAQVNQLTADIIGVLQGQTGSISSLVADTASLMGNLAAHQGAITQVIDNLTTLLTALGGHEQQIGQLIDGLDQLAGGLASEGPQIGQAITGVGQLESTVAGLMGQSQSAFRQDVSGLAQSVRTLATDQGGLDAVVTNLPPLLTSLNKISNTGNYLSTYLCDLTIHVQGTLYALAAPVNLPSGPVGNQSVHTKVCQ